jgi:ferredoxin
MTGVLITFGKQDVLEAGAAERVAERAGVRPCDLARIDGLAERALKPGDRAWASALAGEGPLVIGCSRPRAARALLAFAGVAYSQARVEWLALPFDRGALKAEYGVPWYPVIDRARCTGCGTCADYCLFSVYCQEPALPAGERVRVTAPLSCKTGCPACARLCPEGALIFPFCNEVALNGEVAEPERRSREALAAALGDDPMRVLAERRQRKRLIDPAKFEQAERDRVTYSGVL